MTQDERVKNQIEYLRKTIQQILDFIAKNYSADQKKKIEEFVQEYSAHAVEILENYAKLNNKQSKSKDICDMLVIIRKAFQEELDKLCEKQDFDFEAAMKAIKMKMELDGHIT